MVADQILAIGMSVTRHAILTLIFALGPLPALLTGCGITDGEAAKRLQSAVEPAQVKHQLVLPSGCEGTLCDDAKNYEKQMKQEIQQALKPYTDRLAATYVQDLEDPLTDYDIFGAELPITLGNGLVIHKYPDYVQSYYIERDSQIITYVQFNEYSPVPNMPANPAEFDIVTAGGFELTATNYLSRQEFFECIWVFEMNTWICYDRTGAVFPAWVNQM